MGMSGLPNPKWPDDLYMGGIKLEGVEVTKLRNEDLEFLVAGLDDGLPIGDDVREKLSDAICELIERRKKEQDGSLMELMEARIRDAQAEFGRKYAEEVEKAVYYGYASGDTGKAPPYEFWRPTPEIPAPKPGFRYKGQKAKWRRRHDTDHEELVAPDGTVIAKIDGLTLVQFKSGRETQEYMQKVEREAMKLWLTQQIGKGGQYK